MMIRKLQSIMALWVVVGLLAGCQAMTGRTAGQNIDDATLTTMVKTELAKEKLGTLTRVDVDTTRGVVSLTGVVTTPQLKSRAEEIARNVNGVKKVVNNLQIQKTS